jgi:hypothetical protein
MGPGEALKELKIMDSHHWIGGRLEIIKGKTVFIRGSIVI